MLHSLLRKIVMCGHLVIWSFVKIENGCVKTATIYKYKYLYIVSNDRISEIENDQMTMTK